MSTIEKLDSVEFLSEVKAPNLLSKEDIENLHKYGYYGDDLLVIPEGTTEIGQGLANKNAKCVIIPNSVTTIRAFAFLSNKKLLQIEIPDSVVDIHDSAFRWCRNLTITFNSLIPCEVGYANFDDLKKIIVPAQALETYKEAWPDYANKIEAKTTVFDSNVEISGNLIVSGEAIESNLENVTTPQNTITLRKDAEVTLLEGEYTGIIAEKYDGSNNGMLVFDNTGTAYVGDEGDLQPLATRAPSDDLEDGHILTWNATQQKLVDGGSTILNLQNGEGTCAVVQKQGGAYGSSGSIWPNCIATGINAIAFGAENEAHGANAFIAGGHGSKAYQFDATVFGSDNIVGDAEKQAIFDGLIALAQGETIKDKISYLKQNWASVQEQWNTEHPDQTIAASTFDDAQHVLKYSFGFAAGTSNIVKSRAGAVFGTHNTVTGENALGFGLYNIVSGHNSIVGGSNNLNTGGLALVFGQDCKNEYNYVTITGRGCIAGRDNQRVTGQFNVVDNSAVDIVGWGASDTQRNNIYTLSQYGDARFGGRVTAENGFVSPSGSNVVITPTGDISARGVVYANSAWVSTIDEDTTGQILITKNYINNKYIKKTNATVTPDADKVVQRDANGCAQFNNPINNNDAATKEYVDQKLAEINTALEEIIKIQNSLIGGNE